LLQIPPASGIALDISKMVNESYNHKKWNLWSVTATTMDSVKKCNNKVYNVNYHAKIVKFTPKNQAYIWNMDIGSLEWWHRCSRHPLLSRASD
jgi:hypothetical protein